MCDHAWVMLAERIRADRLAAWTAYLMAGEQPPDPDVAVADLRDLIATPPETEYEKPELRRLRALLGI